MLSEKENKQWIWILLGSFLFMIFLLIIIGIVSEEKDKNNQSEMPYYEEELETEKNLSNPEKDAESCKQKTIEKYEKDMYFFCGCYCGSFFWEENVDELGDCLKNCWENFETIWKEIH